MITYGKKKSLLSAFSVFHDDKHRLDSSNKQSTRNAIKDLKKKVKRTKDNAKLQKPPEDSIDELANALLDDPMQTSVTMSPYSAVSPDKVPDSASSKAMSEMINKPLPTLPDKKKVTPRLDKPLPPISTYRYIPRSADKDARNKNDNTLKKQIISAPVLQSLHTRRNETPVTPSVSNSGYTESPRGDPFLASEDAADLSGKLLKLMRKTSTKGPKPTPVSQQNVGRHVRKNSRFQRSKEIFARATQAITDRLGSSGEKQVDRSIFEQEAPLCSSPDELADFDYQPDTDNESRKRVAESANLGNPKVKNLIGNGGVKRKPLLVYDSMKSSGSNLSSPNDPFLDDKFTPIDLPSPGFGDFDFDVEFDKHPPRPSTCANAHEPLLAGMQPDVDSGKISRQPARSAHAYRYSELISGLAQNPPNVFFSGSPVAESTPRYRLEPQFDAKGKKRLSTVLASSPSQLDLSPPDSEKDVQALPERTLSRSTISLKRKTGRNDLRGIASPLSKKAKKHEQEETTLEAELSTLASVSVGPLAPKDANKRLSRSKIPATKGTGLKIFEVGKGKTTMPRRAESGAKARPRSMAKRSSIPVPVKQTDGIERRASTPVNANALAFDEMSIDELA